MDTIGGLPAHPLVVHAPVVLIPFAAFGTILLAARLRWVAAYGPLVVFAAFVGFVGAILATNSGEALEEVYESSGQDLTPVLRDHAEMGGRVPWIAGLFLVLVAVWVWSARRHLDRSSEHPPVDSAIASSTVRPVSRRVALGLAVASAVVGLVATVAVTRTGHSGAASVWEQVTP
jgi:uncharacterized membrane protein